MKESDARRRKNARVTLRGKMADDNQPSKEPARTPVKPTTQPVEPKQTPTEWTEKTVKVPVRKAT